MQTYVGHVCVAYVDEGFINDEIFVCLRIFFRSLGDETITDEGLQILTYARHSWSLSRL